VPGNRTFLRRSLGNAYLTANAMVRFLALFPRAEGRCDTAAGERFFDIDAVHVPSQAWIAHVNDHVRRECVPGQRAQPGFLEIVGSRSGIDSRGEGRMGTGPGADRRGCLVGRHELIDLSQA
jgi:hypothetical protein